MEKNLGHATAYGYAKSKGYSGTEEEFAELMADYASVGQSAAQSAEQAAASATSASGSAATASQAAQTATSKASEAVTAAGTATTKASEASTSADTASTAAQTATDKASEATTAASTATTKASEAAVSANTATTAKTDAETARDAAAQSASEAAASAESIDPETLEHKAYGAYVVESASGAVVSFPDGADNIPMKDVLVHIDPVQAGSGDPSPDNVRPISGWTGAKVTRCGKNLIPTPYQSAGGGATTVNGITFTPHEDGSITVDGTATANAIYYLRSSDKALPLKAGTYTMKGIPNGSSSTLSFRVYTTASTIGYARDTDYTFTLDQSEVISLSLYVYDGYTANNEVIKPMLVYGSTATDYEPYSGQTYDITFPTEAGTVYGGTLDVTSGVLMVDRAMVDLGAVDYRYNTANTLAFDTEVALSPLAKNNNCICSHYMTLPVPVASNIKNNDKFVAINIKDDGPKYTGTYVAGTLIVKDTEYSDVDSFKSAMSGVQLCYKLATPITYQLTPQEITSLLGTNNLWADTGDSEVEYRADTKMYIARQIADAVSALS